MIIFPSDYQLCLFLGLFRPLGAGRGSRVARVCRVCDRAFFPVRDWLRHVASDTVHVGDLESFSTFKCKASFLFLLQPPTSSSPLLHDSR